MRRVCFLVALVASLLLPPSLSAKGGGGHGGGGHGGGGHAAGAHSGTSHSSSGQAHGSTIHAAARNSGSTSSTVPGDPGHTRTTQPVVGTAVPRSTVPSSPSISTPIVVSGFLPRAGLIGGLGFYDPFWLGAAVGAYGVPFYGDIVPPLSALDPFDTTGPSGALRLKIQPREARVFVDGFLRRHRR